jgi:endoglucanase
MQTTALRFSFLVAFFLMLVACAMVAPAPEATPAPTPEATPAPTPEATPAPAPEATPAPTPEATPAPAPEATPAPTPEATPAPTPEATLGDDASVFNPFLKAVDHEIRDNHGQGDVIYLRGVNLGGWLLFERWLTPMDATGNLKDDWTVRDKLTQRFGPEMRDSLIASYEDAWITEDDLDKIAALGFNVIRLPFWYRNLQEEEDQTWRKGDFKIDWRKGGGEKIDWLVANAWKRHIYVILDFHGLPGGQSVEQHTGRERIKSEPGEVEPDFWNNNNENVLRSTEIWKEIARHFKNNPAVAAYDLINEPMGAPSRKALWDVYDRFYTAVRAIDPDHIITLEACWRGQAQGKDINWDLDVLPDPKTKPYGWTNVVYQMHAYERDAPKDLEKQLKQSKSIIDDIDRPDHRDWNVPCLVGEFNCMEVPQAWDETIRRYEKHHVNWTMWTYKAITDTDYWGVYNLRNRDLAKPDVEHDLAKDIRSKWSKWTTDAVEPNPDHLRAMAMPVPVNHRYTCGGGTKLVENAPGLLANVTDMNPDAGKGKFKAHPVPKSAHGSLILTAHGSLILNEDGSFTYTPTNTFRGVDHFRYRVFDGKYESVLIGTVTINVE